MFTNRRRFLTAGLIAPLAAQEQQTEAFKRTPGARLEGAARSWFSRAGFGLFVCWGPCSVGEIEIGWGMFRDVGMPYWPVEKYNALADRFNPSAYEPDKWLAAAARAGFQYTVFLVRHHDGYALWPSDYGSFSTKQHLGGRDLVKPFVDACRRHGLKVGLYYSPNDWNFNPPGWPYRGYPLRDPNFEYRRPERTLGLPRFAKGTREEFQRRFEEIYAYVKGQTEEILTRWGKIDLLWWDGWDWPDVDHHGPELDALARKLQPGIVTNDRLRLWSERPRLGDFSTEFENRNPSEAPPGAWEQCEAICGGWSWRGEKAACKPASHIVERLVRNRAWGGNYLPDFGPRPDGTMAPSYYAIMEQLAGWMRHSGESVRDVQAGPFPKASDVPVTVRGATWYLHFLRVKEAVVTGVREPKAARVLRTGRKLAWKRDGARVRFTLPEAPATPFDEVAAVEWAG